MIRLEQLELMFIAKLVVNQSAKAFKVQQMKKILKGHSELIAFLVQIFFTFCFLFDFLLCNHKDLGWSERKRSQKKLKGFVSLKLDAQHAHIRVA